MDQPSRPPFRPAEIITIDELTATLASGDAESIYFALVDGSRCLDAKEVYPLALPLMGHTNHRIRWAAVFAVDQCRDCLPEKLADDFEPILTLVNLATFDNDENVRHIAGMTLGDIIGLLVRRLHDAKPPRTD
jgi:hypothetical protein